MLVQELLFHTKRGNFVLVCRLALLRRKHTPLLVGVLDGLVEIVIGGESFHRGAVIAEEEPFAVNLKIHLKDGTVALFQDFNHSRHIFVHLLLAADRDSDVTLAHKCLGGLVPVKFQIGEDKADRQLSWQTFETGGLHQLRIKAAEFVRTQNCEQRILIIVVIDNINRFQRGVGDGIGEQLHAFVIEIEVQGSG